MLSAVDMTFTRKNVLRAVWEVENAERLGNLLGVPRSKRDEIARQFSSDPQKRKKVYINYVMDHDPAASWRSVIVALDQIGEIEAADKIRGLAEPVTGKPLSLSHSYHEEAARHTLSLTVSLTHSLRPNTQSPQPVSGYDIS